MPYTREEYERNTRNAVGCIAILTILGMCLIWLFFEQTRTPSLLYEGPPVETPADEPVERDRDEAV